MATETPDPGGPADYDPAQFPAFAVTVDVVILTMSDSRLHVLLVRRGVPPFEGMWAIPGGFKRPDRDLGRGGEARAGRGDRRRRRGPADPVRRLRRSRARPADERRHGRISGCASRSGRRRRRHGRGRLPPCPGLRRARGRSSSWRSITGGSCATRSSVFASTSSSRASRRRSSDRRSPWPSCGPCTRPSGACSLDSANFRRSLLSDERLGDPDRPPGTARIGRRQAGRALPRREAWRARRPDPSSAANRGGEGRHEGGCPRPLRPAGRPAARGGRAAGPRRRSAARQGPRLDRNAVGLRLSQRRDLHLPLLHRPPPAEAEDPGHGVRRGRRSGRRRPSPSSRSATASSASRARAPMLSSPASERAARSPAFPTG